MDESDNSIRELRQLFVDQNKEALNLKEAYRLLGRDLSLSEQSNKKWLMNHLTPLRKRGLVESIYARGQHPKVLVGIQLTSEGKNHLTSQSSRSSELITLESVTQLIREFEKQNPSAQIEFNITYKKEES